MGICSKSRVDWFHLSLLDCFSKKDVVLNDRRKNIKDFSGRALDKTEVSGGQNSFKIFRRFRKLWNSLVVIPLLGW